MKTEELTPKYTFAEVCRRKEIEERDGVTTIIGTPYAKVYFHGLNKKEWYSTFLEKAEHPHDFLIRYGFTCIGDNQFILKEKQDV